MRQTVDSRQVDGRLGAQGSGLMGQKTMMRAGRQVSAASALAMMLVLAGCRQDMHDQPKFYPQRGTELFADGRSARPQVDNTVARSQLHEDTYFDTGMTGGAEGNSFPFPVTMEVVERGQERYNVYCTPCHSRVGNGAGMIVQRGYRPAGNFHTERLRNAPLGHFFSVMTNGYGAMPDYASQLTPADRWAVVAYIRALQLSQNAAQTDVASGQHAQPLGDIAHTEGFAPGFVNDWSLPSTAMVYGTPNGQDNGIPGQDKAVGSEGQSPAKGAAAKTGAAKAAPAGAGTANNASAPAGASAVKQ